MRAVDRFRIIDGTTLKIIACVIMLIDHITAGIMRPVVENGYYPDTITFEQLERIYNFLRGVGRSAFPIFCFLLVEGFIHTSSRLRYALSLFIFGILSEPVFDAAFVAQEQLFDINIVRMLTINKAYLGDHCNVYFTLLLGLLVIWAIESSFKFVHENELGRILPYVVSAAAIAAGIFVAERLHTDYHGYGVALIVIMYIFRKNEPVNIIGSYLFISFFNDEFLSFPGFALMFLYNKKRGRKLGNLKYLFYAFYPVHILVIYLVRCILWG